MIRLAVRVRREQAEIALAELLELAPRGVEETDLGDRIEYAIYGAPGELPQLPDLEAAAGDALVEISTSEVADDWAERWRDFHQPIVVEDAASAVALRVRAPWHAPAGPGDARAPLEVVIDPGQAFGTGAHHTTRLCLELLLSLGAPPAPASPGSLPDDGPAVLDAGCGSGVLAISAAKLGYGPVAGFDHERESVEATAENAVVNDVAVAVWEHDLLRDGPTAAAPLVLANLLRPLLLRIAREGWTGAAPRTLIASGLLAHEADEVAAAFASAHGLVEVDRRHGGEWAALLLQRP